MDIKEQIRDRAAALDAFPGQTIPEATREMLEQADRVAGGTIFFYGRTPVEVGLRDIDWSAPHVKHQEWPAQLNRFFFLRPLAAAYRKTREERYASAARAYIQDWLAAARDYNNAQAFQPGDSGLNMSIRLGTSEHSGWGGTLPAFLDSPAFDAAFLAEMVASMGVQAHFLSRHLTAWGNWRISELDALVFTALRFPFIEGAEKLLQFGIRGMRNALATQFLSDGVHIERTPGYATWMTRVAASYVDLGRRFPEADARVEPRTVAAALDYVAQSQLCGMNDAGVVLRDPPELRDLALRKTLLPRVSPREGVPPPPPLDQAFPAAGQVFSRTSWEPGAQALAFDASTWGGGHGHLSRLSFSFRAGGRLLVADPGILSYEMSDPRGPYGKSTRAHSTLSVNGWNQSPVDAVLHRVDLPAGGGRAPGTALIHAEYSGSYWEGEYGWSFPKGLARGAYGSHERVLFWVKGEYLLVLDRMETDRGATVHNCWQLGPMEGWEQEPESRAWWSCNPDMNLSLQLLHAPDEVVMECFEGSQNPLRGWVGAHGQAALPAPLVEFRYPGHPSGVESAVLLVPFAGADRPSYPAQFQRSGAARVLKLATPKGTTDCIAWTPRLESPIEIEGEIATDSPFVWLRTLPASGGRGSGKLAASCLLGGTYLEWQGQIIFDKSKG